MTSSNVLQILVFLHIIIAIDALLSSHRIDRKSWTWGRLPVSSIYNYIGYEDDLRILIRFNPATFRQLLVALEPFANYPKDFYRRLSLASTNAHSTKPCALSFADRLLRAFMICTNKPISGLVSLFGQKKSTVYEDFKFVMRLIVHALGDEHLSLPAPDSDEYEALYGDGVFSDQHGNVLFDNVVYVADVCCIKIRRPTCAQRSYYSGHKKCHTLNFHFVHDGRGVVKNITGPQPGSGSDISLAKQCPVYTHPHLYLRPNDGILADLAYYYIGRPFVCRVGYQSSYTDEEQRYNVKHSQSRVICENYYCRFKLYWPIVTEAWRFKMSDLDMTIRALAIATNIIIAEQAPLRRFRQ